MCKCTCKCVCVCTSAVEWWLNTHWYDKYLLCVVCFVFRRNFFSFFYPKWIKSKNKYFPITKNLLKFKFNNKTTTDTNSFKIFTHTNEFHWDFNFHTHFHIMYLVHKNRIQKLRIKFIYSAFSYIYINTHNT